MRRWWQQIFNSTYQNRRDVIDDQQVTSKEGTFCEIGSADDRILTVLWAGPD
jgi:hypothetical protein